MTAPTRQDFQANGELEIQKVTDRMNLLLQQQSPPMLDSPKFELIQRKYFVAKIGAS